MNKTGAVYNLTNSVNNYLLKIQISVKQNTVFKVIRNYNKKARAITGRANKISCRKSCPKSDFYFHKELINGSTN